MNNKEKEFEDIEQYLRGKLSGQKLADFENRLNADPSLAAEVKLHGDLEAALLEDDVQDLSSKMDVIFQDSRIHPLRRPLAIAASILLVISVTTVIYLNLGNGPMNAQTLYSQHINFPDIIPGDAGVRTLKDGDDNTSNLLLQINESWKQTAEAYARGDLEVALNALDKIQAIDPGFERQSRSRYYYYLGIIQLKMDRPNDAVSSFEEITLGTYARDANWKKALALLLLESRKDEAKQALQDIIDFDHPKKDAAKAILTRLKASK